MICNAKKKKEIKRQASKQNRMKTKQNNKYETANGTVHVSNKTMWMWKKIEMWHSINDLSKLRWVWSAADLST